MAKQQAKKGGRVTAKGTKPPEKAPRSPKAPGASSPAEAAGSPNRQIRRSGSVGEQPSEPNAGRMKLILGIGGAVSVALLVATIVLFGVSGTTIGIIGTVAGVLGSLAVSTGKTWFADKGRYVAIGIGAVGVAFFGFGISGVTDVHWPAAALIGCGLGAFLVEVSSQQMTPPQGPPAAAVALLRRSNAQEIPVPAAGNCVWAMPDGKIVVIIGASVPDGTTADDVVTNRNVRTSRQRATMVQRRLAGLRTESGLICVVDQPITTVRDGDDTICSATGLNRALSR